MTKGVLIRVRCRSPSRHGFPGTVPATSVVLWHPNAPPVDLVLRFRNENPPDLPFPRLFTGG